jgi:hypothetical protein
MRTIWNSSQVLDGCPGTPDKGSVIEEKNSVIEVGLVLYGPIATAVASEITYATRVSAESALDERL